MFAIKLTKLQNMAVRSRGRLKLASFLLRTSESRFLDKFQRDCWLCRQLWPASSSIIIRDFRIRRISDNQVFSKLQKYKYNILMKDATFCTTPSDTNNDTKNKGRETENILTIPNALCIARIGMTPFIANCILHSQYQTAIGLLVIAGITDLLDGWVARVVPGQASVMGSFLDPLSDKILVGATFLSLTYMSLIPALLTALIVGRDAILIAFGFYIRFRSLDPPRTLGRYFNVALPTAQLAPTFISKINTGLQLSVVAATLASTVISSVDLHPYLQILWLATGTTTVATAVHYCFAKDTVKLLKQFKAKPKK